MIMIMEIVRIVIIGIARVLVKITSNSRGKY